MKIRGYDRRIRKYYPKSISSSGSYGIIMGIDFVSSSDIAKKKKQKILKDRYARKSK